MPGLVRYYRQPGLEGAEYEKAKVKIEVAIGQSLTKLETEICYYVQILGNSADKLTREDEEKLLWILSVPFSDNKLTKTSSLSDDQGDSLILIEVGPRLNFSTPSSTNAVSICSAVGLTYITRIERSIRYSITVGPCTSSGSSTDATALRRDISAVLHDRMTECCYDSPLESFDLNVVSEAVYDIDVIGMGKEALMKANADLGLSFDDWDIEYYTDLFVNKIKRNPTSVECFDLAQSNSEHSRHWFFRGRLIIDDEEIELSLLKMVMNTQQHSNQNNIIKFSDNSSAIEGGAVSVLGPTDVTKPAAYTLVSDDIRHVIYTAETHNFPTGVAPFPGATTGTGGRIRDVQAAGRGAHVIAGTAGYCFGNLLIPGYTLPWEDPTFQYSDSLARPLDIAIEASNGASDYGNKFGEPILSGFSRSFGQLLPSSERREWIKPIMFTGGVGSICDLHVNKLEPQIGMEVVKIGGPVYRIGVGGGAASSARVEGGGDKRSADLDLGAVQRGDAEMEQKMNRVVRACIELRHDNPICSIHDQGAGGNGNVLKELCYPCGALIKASGFQLGDPTLSLLELWGAEYQESNALLTPINQCQLLRDIAARERCPVSFVGSITGDGRLRLKDDRKEGEREDRESKKARIEEGELTKYPVDLELEAVLSDMPRKVFRVRRVPISLRELSLPTDLQVMDALNRVLRLPAVASKRYLTNKVDRSVTGLVAQQQCVGPLHTPLADCAVVAISHFDKIGSATAIGEQPIKLLVDPASGARMCVAESLTNLMFAHITDIKDVKCSGNWMWPAKQDGEDCRLYEACRAMCDVMKELGIAVDGGKDSLSMTVRVKDSIVKSPGSLVISNYAVCPNVNNVVTPDLKCPPGGGVLLFVPLSTLGLFRLGGSALAQCYSQVGHESPDLDSPALFSAAFNTLQQLIQDGQIESGHDVSDGGLITCILEMCFAGNCSIDVCLPAASNKTVTVLEQLFNEELGVVLEVTMESKAAVVEAFSSKKVLCTVIGRSYLKEDNKNAVLIKLGDQEVLKGGVSELRDIWEETSFQLERLQTNPICVEQEVKSLRSRVAPHYHLNFSLDNLTNYNPTSTATTDIAKRPRVAVLREEGSNGDREMAATLYMAGFEVWDVNTEDLCSGKVSLSLFRGVVFVGGFSYADVFGSAKGWAATLKYNEGVRREFDDFYSRDDTFSLGVCNGCQLMALLGWVAVDEDNKENGAAQGVYLAHNESGRFESRFVTVRVMDSPAMMLNGMKDSVLGIWVAHGEGRVVLKNSDIETQLNSNHLIPLCYVDDESKPTTSYPLNPNGSPGGIAALCSPDGRHLAMMPHPERAVLPWQWPWAPRGLKQEMRAKSVAPWMKMFRNAYEWCVKTC